MLFGTPIFLFVFLPLVLTVYYLLPKKNRNLLLLLASLFFYAWGEQKLVVVIIVSTFIDYSLGILIDKGFRKLGLYLSILFNLSILIYFKYAVFAFENISRLFQLFSFDNIDSFLDITLPIGISFYTFQTMSYTIDVYRGNIKANYNLIDFACYVTLFPQLIAGPIVKYKEVSLQLKERQFCSTQFSEGIERFVIGLAKKMIIANNCAFLVDGIFLLTESELGMLLAWIGAIAYCLQLYFDFSGYSDMAIGLGKMFGFDFLENFDHPFTSKSVKEFWRRWHISLSSWFRDYVYIPLGGNRISVSRNVFNILIVFLITGIWHGANWTFVLWGILHGLFIVFELLFLEKYLSKYIILSRIYLLLFIVLTFIIFRSQNLNYAFDFFKKMISFDSYLNSEHIAFYLKNEVIITMVLAIIFSTSIYKRLLRPFLLKKKLLNVSLIILFLISILYVSLDTYNPFIYFRF